LVSYQITSAVIAVVIVALIGVLIRRDLLHTRYSLWWLGVAALVLLFGFFPRLIDTLGRLLGVHYPPILLVVLAMGAFLVKILTMDLERSRQERKLRRFAQRLAMYEAAAGMDPDPDERPSGPERT
jgi:hypothetical protein